MNENMQIVFGLLGGLAIFIYGMNMMSECLQKAAGNRICQCRTYEPATGNFYYIWCKYRNNHDGTDYCI